MINRTLPKVTEIEVVGTQPKASDLRKIEFIASRENIAISPVTYLVKIELEDSEAALSGQGFSLYVGDQRIEKYSGYKNGIYFTVNDPRFFDEHRGEEIRLSFDDETIVDTGKTLPVEPVANVFLELESIAEPVALPTQEEVLQADLEPTN